MSLVKLVNTAALWYRYKPFEELSAKEISIILYVVNDYPFAFYHTLNEMRIIENKLHDYVETQMYSPDKALGNKIMKQGQKRFEEKSEK